MKKRIVAASAALAAGMLCYLSASPDHSPNHGPDQSQRGAAALELPEPGSLPAPDPAAIKRMQEFFAVQAPPSRAELERMQARFGKEGVMPPEQARRLAQSLLQKAAAAQGNQASH